MEEVIVTSKFEAVVIWLKALWSKVNVNKWAEDIGGSSSDAVHAAIYFGMGFAVGFLFKKYFMMFYREWSTFGKYEKIRDASKALQLVAKDTDHLYHNNIFRVLLKGKKIFEGHITPENSSLIMKN